MIKGVVGKAGGNLAFLVEGVCRVSIDKIVSERPFFEADVTYHHDHGTWMAQLLHGFKPALSSKGDFEIWNILCQSRLYSRARP